jgi:hypothetical protein
LVAGLEGFYLLFKVGNFKVQLLLGLCKGCGEEEQKEAANKGPFHVGCLHQI